MTEKKERDALSEFQCVMMRTSWIPNCENIINLPVSSRYIRTQTIDSRKQSVEQVCVKYIMKSRKCLEIQYGCKNVYYQEQNTFIMDIILHYTQYIITKLIYQVNEYTQSLHTGSISIHTNIFSIYMHICIRTTYETYCHFIHFLALEDH